MRIELQGLELHGFHGVLSEERRDGQRFLFDLELDYAEPTAPLTDRIEDAIDYRKAVAIVREVSDGRAYQLLEALADALAVALLDALPLTRARVRVRKPDVELGVPVEHAAAIADRYREVRASST